MILGVITAEGSGQSHAAIIARAMNIPGIVQVGKDCLLYTSALRAAMKANGVDVYLIPVGDPHSSEYLPCLLYTSRCV